MSISIEQRAAILERSLKVLSEIEMHMGEAMGAEAFICAVNDPTLGPMMFVDPGYVGNLYVNTKPLVEPLRHALDSIIDIRAELLASDDIDELRNEISVLCTVIKQIELQLLRLGKTITDLKELMDSLEIKATKSA